jgi:hypothetical protein
MTIPPQQAQWDPALSPARLAEANINPVTGLSTDYLNHFNEAIMLLEMLPTAPDCRIDFLAWRPMSYSQHFTASTFKYRELAILAYEKSNPAIRGELDTLADTMTEVLTAIREAMELGSASDASDKLAERAVAWLKPLIARAGAVINGGDIAGEAPQVTVDALMRRHNGG